MARADIERANIDRAAVALGVADGEGYPLRAAMEAFDQALKEIRERR